MSRRTGTFRKEREAAVGSVASAVANDAHNTTPSMPIRDAGRLLIESTMVAGSRRPNPVVAMGSMAADAKEVCQ
jgi:hypothetical protein